LRIIHIATSDINGGAAKASYRIHRALLKSGVNSKLLVLDRSSNDKEVILAKSSALRPTRLRTHISYALMKLQRTNNTDLHSAAIFPSGLVQMINEFNADIVNLHWVQGEFISIEDIGKITKPIIWTLHDMWAFCGGEHYSSDTRFIDGYTRCNRAAKDHGIDLNRWIWQRKLVSWKRPINIVCPSTWLMKAATKSKLMRDWPISLIHYPINSAVYHPIKSGEAKARLNLRADSRIILFGAVGIDKDKRKGFDLMIEALYKLRLRFGDCSDFVLATFGAEDLPTYDSVPVDIYNHGYVTKEESLNLIYCSADVVIVPSRSDNLPQIALEAQMSGTPVVAFEVGGLPDIVTHKKTGYLAKAFDTDDLAIGMGWALAQNKDTLMYNIRNISMQKYSESKIAENYQYQYQRVLELSNLTDK
jgi:glycosyltransferase involved in cell wall biosynthesis